MIRYFRESLRSFIWAQLDAQNRDLDSWKEVIKKAVNAEAKVLPKSSSNTCEIDSRCSGGSGSAKKEEKDSERTKSADFLSADAPSWKSIHQSQTNKKDQDHQQGSRCRAK